MATSCRSGGPPRYAIENGAVVYDLYGVKTRLAAADAGTFRPLPLPPHVLGPCEHADDEFYGTDRSKAFYETTAIPDVDPASFRPLPEYEYAEDKRSVFYHGQKLPGADPASFRVLLWPDEKPGPPGSTYLKRPPGEKFSVYAADAGHVWEQGRPRPDLDAATFTMLPMGFTKDKNGVYRDDRLVPGLDPKIFTGTQ